MLSQCINAYSAAWRGAKRAYHTIAFLSLLLVVTSVATGHVSGYYEAVIPLGTHVASVEGSAVLPPTVAENMMPMPLRKHF